MLNSTPPGIVPDGSGGGTPSNGAILTAFAYPVGGAILMRMLSDALGFMRAIWIMVGLVVATLAILTTVLLRKNRRSRPDGICKDAPDE
jgi:hypothetical protein